MAISGGENTHTPETGATPERAEMLNDVFAKAENLVSSAMGVLTQRGMPEDEAKEATTQIIGGYLNACSKDAGSGLVTEEVAQEADIIHYFVSEGLKPDYYGWEFRDTLEKE
jgi:hypothetical protein